jgi:hypothetical protein
MCWSDIRGGYSQLRHKVPYTMFFFGFCLWSPSLCVQNKCLRVCTSAGTCRARPRNRSSMSTSVASLFPALPSGEPNILVIKLDSPLDDVNHGDYLLMNASFSWVCLFIFTLYIFENLRSESLRYKCVHLQPHPCVLTGGLQRDVVYLGWPIAP